MKIKQIINLNFILWLKGHRDLFLMALILLVAGAFPLVLSINRVKAQTVSANLALNKPIISVSSTADGSSPFNAVDGNPATFWTSRAGGTQWIGIDLGAITDIGTVVVKWGTDAATSYDIELSTDGIGYAVVWSGINGDFNSAINRTGRYIQIHTKSGTNPNQYQLGELEVYVALPSAPTPTAAILPTNTPVPTAIPTVVLIPTVTPTAVPSGATISLNPAITYQTFTSWEGTDYIGDPLTPAILSSYKNILADKLVNEYGLNRIRLEMTAGVENSTDYFSQYLSGQLDGRIYVHCYAGSPINDDNDPNYINPAGFQFSSLDWNIDNMVLPLKQKLEANGEKLFINLNFVSFNFDPTCPAGVPPYPHTWRQYNDANEYAELMLTTFQHIQTKYGFTPDTLEMILEPDNSSFNGTLIGQALIATQALLSRNGFNPKYIVPSTTQAWRALPYFNDIRTVLVNSLGSAAVANSFIKNNIQEISYHRYGAVPNDATLQSIANTSVSYGIGTSMLECWTIAGCANGYQTLHADLKAGRNTAWQEGTLLGIYDVDITNPTNPIVTISNQSKFIRQYTKFIRSGAVRIEAATTNTSFDPLAFINKDGKYTIVVKAAAGGSFSIGGLPIGTYGIKYTTSTQYNIDLADQTIAFGQNLSTSIPAAGAITIYAKTTTGPALTPTAAPSPTPTPIPPTATPTTVPCSLTSATWSTTTATEGNTVNLNVSGNTNCAGKTVDFEVRRNGTLLDDIAANFQPQTATISASLQATTTWVAERNPFIIFTDPEYYFKATPQGGTTIDTKPQLLTVTTSQGGTGTPTPTPIATAPNDWPQVQKDAQHTGYSSETLGTNFKVAWTYPFQPDRVFPQTQAIIYQGKAIVGTEGANGQKPTIYALNATSGQANSGKLAWKFEAGGPILNSVAAYDNKIFFGAMDGAVYAIDSSTGAQVWKNQLSQDLGFVTAPVVADNKVMLGGQDGNFYALDPNDGHIIWKYDIGAPIFQTAAYNNGKVFFGGMDMYVYALNTNPANPNDLAAILSWKSQRVSGFAFKDYWPVVTQGKVVINPMIRKRNTGVIPGYPFGWYIDSTNATFLTWLSQNSAAVAAGNMTQVAELMNAQDTIISSYTANPGNYTHNLYILDETTGQQSTIVPNWNAQSLSGAHSPPCVDRDNKLIVPILFIGSGWGRLDLTQKRITDVLYDGLDGKGNPFTGLPIGSRPNGIGNADENLNATCTANLILSMHFQEGNANFTGAFNQDTRKWTMINAGMQNKQMSSVLEGRTDPASVSNGMIYHISWHELVARTTN